MYGRKPRPADKLNAFYVSTIIALAFNFTGTLKLLRNLERAMGLKGIY